MVLGSYLISRFTLLYLLFYILLLAIQSFCVPSALLCKILRDLPYFTSSMLSLAGFPEIVSNQVTVIYHLQIQLCLMLIATTELKPSTAF